MYNSIHPINITYRNQRQSSPLSGSDEQNKEQAPVSYQNGSSGNNREFPNGTKVAIDYTKNTVNISQIVTDFKSTVIAIGAPEDISQEVNSYLSLVERESKKANPSRDIIYSNLINASKISDNYIYQELSKKKGNAPKNVVEGWIDALFKQKVDLKADPTQINPDYQLDIPNKKRVKTAANETPSQIQEEQPSADVTNQTPSAQVLPDDEQAYEPQIFARQISPQDTLDTYESAELPIQDDTQTSDLSYYKSEDSDDTISFKTIDLPDTQNIPVQEVSVEQPHTLANTDTAPDLDEVLNEEVNIAEPQVLHFVSNTKKPIGVEYITNEHDRVLSGALKEAKGYLTIDDDPALALETLNDALGEANSDTNKNLRAALHFERGKIFDDYDYVSYALRDYYEATKTQDNNLKSQAHLKMARIYDDYVDFEPAVEHYQSALGYSGEASNTRAQTKILTEMATMFAQRYDLNSAKMLSELSLDAASESQDTLLLSKTYSAAAKNYEYLGEDFAALDCYKNAFKSLSTLEDDSEVYELRAQSYEDAAGVMDRLGNVSKSENLLSKARLYRQRAQLAQMSEAV
ncbi:TPA: hypothetical protein IAA86_02440 [Candidatus Galligastranaerophilus intestinavium]|uniref:Tetratricopeptide repeat protein n=1 Tax=Candidatus Galligastranaerophilus intestinavium TaxID=2840836 RepID=A0A9D1FHN2_9BACT|nr:hypothetical protein [Candidatus Galligastranaerophilus intestinavium]